jgi:leucyl aminopeptidase
MQRSCGRILLRPREDNKKLKMIHCHIAKPKEAADFVLSLIADSKSLDAEVLGKEFMPFFKKKTITEETAQWVTIGERTRVVWLPGKKSEPWMTAEKLRKLMVEIRSRMKAEGVESLLIDNGTDTSGLSLSAAEGFVLSDYSFDKYITSETGKKKNKFNIAIRDKAVTNADLKRLSATAEAVCFVRDLVNEPQNVLTATRLAELAVESGKNHGFKVEVLNKKKIESLKMGGLLSVNRGSVEPPAFIIAEWKPQKTANKKPIVLVGKGVVYDTGGLSLKPTPASMDMMKCDMAGAGAVLGTMQAIAANQLPLHVIALIPATDNRPSGEAYAPGDVITMMSGATVEVLNTDAEGRLILADSLHYAKRYKPELVIDLATLTGAAVRALGSGVAASMGTASENDFDLLNACGLHAWERLVWFPLWDDYKEQLKSSIADLTNLGGPEAGHITAGKFLEHFTDYPWMHIDIAGPAFLTSADGYRPKGGTGFGVRLLVDFLTTKYKIES